MGPHLLWVFSILQVDLEEDMTKGCKEVEILFLITLRHQLLRQQVLDKTKSLSKPTPKYPSI
jgi:hypothetical protein